MAKCRMFQCEFVKDYKFTSLPPNACKAYLILNVYADDEGFVANAKGLFNGQANRVAINTLVERGYLYFFEERGVAVIRHWHVHNHLRADRITPTIFSEIKSQLVLNSEKVYVFKGKTQENKQNLTNEHNKNDKVMTSFCCHFDKQNVSQGSIGKGSIGKDSVGEGSIGNIATPEEVSAILDVTIDVSPTHPLSIYEKALEEINRSSFAKRTVKSLSYLHKHLDKILAGNWVDYHKSDDVAHNYMPQTYTKEEIDSLLIVPGSVNLDDWDP